MDTNFLQTRSYKKHTTSKVTYGNVAISYNNVVNALDTGKQLNYATLMDNIGKAIKDTNTTNSKGKVRTNYHRASRNTMGLL